MSITTALKARREALRGDREAGFTLIELLVVVIIIGILAAIAIPIYVGVQNNAKDSAVKSDLTNAKNAIVAWTQDNPSTLPVALSATNYSKYGYAPSAAYSSTGTPTFASGYTADKWCIDAVSVTTKTFAITTSGAVQQSTCATITSANW